MTDTNSASETAADPHRLKDITEGVAVQEKHSERDMAADVLSPRSDPGASAQVGVNRTSLPPLVTSPPSKAKLERASSYMNKRLSTFSNASNTHQSSISALAPAIYRLPHLPLESALLARARFRI